LIFGAKLSGWIEKPSSLLSVHRNTFGVGKPRQFHQYRLKLVANHKIFESMGMHDDPGVLHKTDKKVNCRQYIDILKKL
jgi:hypothetical protein